MVEVKLILLDSKLEQSLISLDLVLHCLNQLIELHCILGKHVYTSKEPA